MGKRVNRLTNLDIDEISLVDKGANQHAKVLISKRDVSKANPTPSGLHIPRPLGQEEEILERRKKRKKNPGDEEIDKRIAKHFGMKHITPSGESLEDGLQMFGQREQELPDLEEGSMNADGFLPPDFPEDDVEGEVYEGEGIEGDEDYPEAFDEFGSEYDEFDDEFEDDEEFDFEEDEGFEDPRQFSEEPPASGFPEEQAEDPQEAFAGPPPDGTEPTDEELSLAEVPEEVVDYINELENTIQQILGRDDMTAEEGDQVSLFGKASDFDLDGSGYDEDDDLVTTLAKALDELDEEDAYTRDLVSKALEQVSEAQTRAQEAEEIAKAERDYRMTQEFVEVAKGLGSNLPVNPAEFGTVLKRLAETLPQEDYEYVVDVVEKANGLAANSEIFEEFGKSGAYEGDIYSQVRAEAESLISKDGDGTVEKAMSDIFENNPELYDEYLSDHRR